MLPCGFCKVFKKHFLYRLCDPVMETEMFWTYLINKVKIKRVRHLIYKDYESIYYFVNSYSTFSY